MVRFLLLSLFYLGFSGMLMGQSITRSEFLKMDEQGKRSFLKNPKGEISDLVNGNVSLASESNKALIPVDRFSYYPIEKRLTILCNPDHYLIMPANWSPDKIKISGGDLSAMSPDKRENLLKDTARFEVIR